MTGTGRDTSIKALQEVLKSGIVGEQQKRIYVYLHRYGPMTITECFEQIRGGGTEVNDNTRTRFGELRDMGLIREVGKRPCSVTGRTVIVFDVTSNLPRNLPTVEHHTIRIAVIPGTKVDASILLESIDYLSAESQVKTRKATKSEETIMKRKATKPRETITKRKQRKKWSTFISYKEKTNGREI